ncbi:MAG: phage portal protein, partial [Alphaproteobacteria bacterium]
MGILNRLTREPRNPPTRRVSAPAMTLAGVAMSPDQAITIPTVWACLRYMSQTTAFPPWRVMNDGQRGPEIQRKHPVDWLLWKRPSPEWSSFQFRETLTHWALRWGNGYAEIEPDALGRPFAMWPIHPERVEVCRATVRGVDGYGDEIPEGGLYYDVGNGSDGATILAPRRVFHIRGLGEGPVGLNVMAYAAQSLGWARAAQLFGASFFGNGANIGGVVLNKRPLSPEGLDRQREEFAKLYAGPRNANRTAHLDVNADFKPIGIDPDKAQFILTHQHLVEEICRWFGCPPHKVMHLLRATFSNIEHQSIEVVVDSIAPWAKRFEDEADFKLFGQNRPGLYSRIRLNALMRGDQKSRG